MSETAILEAKNVSKSFGEVLANREVSFELRKGEIHGLLGENGAGKSTLMKIISGRYSPDEGEIMMDGRPVRLRHPGDALGRGIGMVHQHFMLVPSFSVAENIMLGSEITCGTRTDMAGAYQSVQNLTERYGLEVDPKAVLEDLPVGMQQRVEILKALYRNARVLILDEPTAVLAPGDIENLLKVMSRLAAEGVAIVFITHKLREVVKIADRITVMRRGKTVATMTAGETDEGRLASMMVGRKIDLKARRPAITADGPVVLEVSRLALQDQRGAPVVRDLSLTVRGGEILGIAGVQGNGQKELADALSGLHPVVSGDIAVQGKRVTHQSPRGYINAGVAHIPEDRIKHGLISAYTIADNQVLRTYRERPFARYGIRNRGAVYAHARKLMDRFDIRASSPATPVSKLSGGNRQKVVVSRELSRCVCCLVANQPTRGLDVGSIGYIHRQLIGLRDRGVALLLISADLDEIMALSDRISVMYSGALLASVDGAVTSRDRIGRMMTGLSIDHAEGVPPMDSR